MMNKQMKPLDEITDEEVQEQIDIRHELINQMVGTLYPEIVYNEIIELRRRQ